MWPAFAFCAEQGVPLRILALQFWLFCNLLSFLVLCCMDCPYLELDAAADVVAAANP